MSVALHQTETLADLVERLGNVPLARIRMNPPPGTATLQDVIDIDNAENRHFELIEGVLVEKAMGFVESLLAIYLGSRLNSHVIPNNLGFVTGADGAVRLFPGLVRIPDVAFSSWSALPEGKLPHDPIPQLAPDLAVEVLSESNTPAEMRRKRREYFEAGVKLVWIVDPPSRTVRVYLAAEESVELTEADTLTGEPVLPGFSLPLAELFAEIDRYEQR